MVANRSGVGFAQKKVRGLAELRWRIEGTGLCSGELFAKGCKKGHSWDDECEIFVEYSQKFLDRELETLILNKINK
jgi:hypothetical protein